MSTNLDNTPQTTNGTVVTCLIIIGRQRCWLSDGNLTFNTASQFPEDCVPISSLLRSSRICTPGRFGYSNPMFLNLTGLRLRSDGSISNLRCIWESLVCGQAAQIEYATRHIIRSALGFMNRIGFTQPLALASMISTNQAR
jgi:hypothetical protein